jgi:hypothetical protein
MFLEISKKLAKIMNKKKLLIATVLLTTTLQYGCATGSNISPVAPELIEAQNNKQNEIKSDQPDLPKLRLKINKAEIQIAEADLEKQLKAIMEASGEKKIEDIKLSLTGNKGMKIEGIYLQKIPLATKPVRLPFIVEGILSVQPNNIIKMDVSKIKIATISVKAFMDILGLELANFLKFKDSIGRIEVSGNSFLMIIEKFSDEAIIEGQIKTVMTEDKLLTVIF